MLKLAVDRLPRLVSPCPIVEATVEVRFISSRVPPEAIVGLVYGDLRRAFPSIQRLPITNLPKPMLGLDGNLRFQPHHRLEGDKRVLLLGPNVLAVSVLFPYPGWGSFSKLVLGVLEVVSRAALFDSPVRLGVRYINFFERNVLDQLRLKMSLDDEPVDLSGSVLRVVADQAPFRCALTITDQATADIEGSEKSGTLLDIDTSLEDVPSGFVANPREVLEAAHVAEKTTFFGILGPTLLSDLHPEF